MWDDDKTDYNCKSLWGPRWSSALPEAGAGSCAVCRLLKNDDMRNDPGHFLTPAGFRRPSLWSIILSDSYFHSSLLLEWLQEQRKQTLACAILESLIWLVE